MDDKTVTWSEERFDEIQKEVNETLKKVGYQPDKIPNFLFKYYNENVSLNTDFEAFEKLIQEIYQNLQKMPTQYPLLMTEPSLHNKGETKAKNLRDYLRKIRASSLFRL